jgi:multidrug efflux pump subunit AcrB
VSLFSLTLVAVAAITAVTLVHPTLIVLVTLTLGMIFVDVLGFLPTLDVKLNTISVANLVMAIGIVVDASAHIAHSFGQQDASLSRHDRVYLAIKEIGGSVLMGAFTTFLGVLPTAGASSEIFRVFFKCFIVVIGVGTAHGLIWLPVMLSLIGASFGKAKQAITPTASFERERKATSDNAPHSNFVVDDAETAATNEPTARV